MGVSGQRHAPAALYLAPGKGTPVPIVQKAGWALEPDWTQRLEAKSFRLCRGSNLDHPIVQPVAKHYTDCATRFTQQTEILQNILWFLSNTQFALRISLCHASYEEQLCHS
jgi:hypothetical protein